MLALLQGWPKLAESYQLLCMMQVPCLAGNVPITLDRCLRSRRLGKFLYLPGIPCYIYLIRQGLETIARRGVLFVMLAVYQCGWAWQASV